MNLIIAVRIWFTYVSPEEETYGPLIWYNISSDIKLIF